MKMLVVFYSLEGNTKFIAESIAAATGADILELKPKKEINTKGFMKYFWGGKQVMMKETPEILPLGKNPQEYDTIFIGTPVWASNYSPPLRTFFSTAKLSDKKIALFCSCGGSSDKTFEGMRTALAGNEIIGEFELAEPLKNKNDSAAKAKKWAKEMVQKSK